MCFESKKSLDESFSEYFYGCRLDLFFVSNNEPIAHRTLRIQFEFEKEPKHIWHH